MAKQDAKDERIDKRRVTMTSWMLIPQEEGDPRTEKHEAVDYVRPDFLEAYVADAKTRWQSVTVSEEPDAGPGGYDGDTNHPVHLQRGTTLQQHLHQEGIKPIDDPSNRVNNPGGQL